jgi:NAD(P)-dependent dehydrogenase (short-subunit alcohol dehydrogenase family)
MGDLCGDRGCSGVSDARARCRTGPRDIRVNAMSPGSVETEGPHASGVIGMDFLQKLTA